MEIKRKNKRCYDISQALGDVSLEALSWGLENVLIHPLSYEKASPGQLRKHKAFIEGYEDMVLIESDGCCLPEEEVGNHVVSICMDHSYGILLYSHCDCYRYQSKHEVCGHISMLIIAYFLQEYGKEYFYRDTMARKVLQNVMARNGVEDPFVPNILRKTSKSLSRLCQRNSRENQPDHTFWLTNQKRDSKGQRQSAARLQAECILWTNEKYLQVELKVGPKRCYVIKNQEQLMEAYLERGSFQFGKKTYSLAKENFTEEARSYMDFFSGLYHAYELVDELSHILPYGSGNQRRYFRLQGRDLDALMQLLKGKTVTVVHYGNEYRCQVDLEKKPEAYTLEKVDCGAKLKLGDETYLGCGIDAVYIRQSEFILSLPGAQADLKKQLIEISNHESDLYLQEKDIEGFLRSLEEVDPELESLQLQGLSLESYIVEKPQAEIYLDYPQEGLISCELKAKYPSKEKIFSVFDRQEGNTFRDLKTERTFADKIWPYFNAFEAETGSMFAQCDEEELFLFLTETIPLLSELGQVFISDSLKRIKVRPIAEVSVGLQVDAGNLLLSVHSAQMDQREMIEVLSAYHRKKKYTRLRNGSFITFRPEQASVWQTIADTYKSYGKKNPDCMKVPLFRALYMDEMLQEREGLALHKDQAYARLVESIGSKTLSEHELPASLAEIMRPYQMEGFRWISMLKEHGFGGILADDMGLGKTLQVLAFLLAEKEKRMRQSSAGQEVKREISLIITPASLVYNWKKEIEKFTPQLICQVIAGPAEQRQLMISAMSGMSSSEAQCADIYITSYDLLKRDITLYEGITFANEIVDEAQFIKNQSTKAAKGVRLIQSDFRLALTGTPIENRLSELWSIFDYLMPGFLYKYSRFRTEFESPVVQKHEEASMERLRKMVHPFILRRLKKEVLKDLPEKIEEIITIQLEDEQRKIYDAHANRLRLFLEKQNEKDFQQGKLEILAELTKLRQICCGPEVFLQNYKGQNAKKEACMELIRQAIDSGHKILLFSQFTSILDELGKSLDKQAIAYHRIDGSTSKEERVKLVSAFDTDDVPVFCISLKAGGTGLNLTAADIVIHFDPWWNVAAQNQASDRAHRIGQENKVVVYQLIAEKTVEEQIIHLQKTKEKLANDLLSGEGISSILIDKESLMAVIGE